MAASRKAKLNITYMLLRKPLQENLFLLESVVADRLDFAEKLATEPLRLRAGKAGGVEAHSKRIQKVLDVVGENHRFSASYLAQLRYDKEAEDGFDGVCNHAIHLFTEHKAIRATPLSINFIFSGWSEKLSQWSYLYSRLPYVLFYISRVVEKIASNIAPTHPEYLDDMERRISAWIILWWTTVEENYISEPLAKFVYETEKWLFGHCYSAGYRLPSNNDLRHMSRSGSFPGESASSIKARHLSYRLSR